MALIPKTHPTLVELCFEAPGYAGDHGYQEVIGRLGGFAPWERDAAKRLTPMKFSEGPALHYCLDSLTGAIEAGLVDDVKWPSQLFKSSKDLQAFLSELSSHDMTDRINDRWYAALSHLGQFIDGDGIITCEAIATEIAYEVDKHDAFSKPATPKAAPKKAAAAKKTKAKAKA